MFRTSSLPRTIVQPLLIASGLVRLSFPFINTFAATSQSVPFIVCKESITWTRPTAAQQAKIWNDPRYSDDGANAYEWNHEFLLVPVDSASIQYHMGNEAGLWTENTFSPTCDNDKRNDEWNEVWILLHRVQRLDFEGSVYTITVEPTAKGFQSILFKRFASNMTFRFIDVSGRLLDEVKETW
jgi:hypothetical protein